MKRNKNVVAINPNSINELEAQVNLLTYYLLGEEACKELRDDTHHYAVISNLDKNAFPSREDALIHDLTDRVLRLRKMVQAKS
jgi:hypothetical protein|nr:MAG TPA: hypothetical protein [Caudoviricetes sp.]